MHASEVSQEVVTKHLTKRLSMVTRLSYRSMGNSYILNTGDGAYQLTLIPYCRFLDTITEPLARETSFAVGKVFGESSGEPHSSP